MCPKSRGKLYHRAPGKATRPKKEIAVGHIRQMAPNAVWLKKKKYHARIIAQNSRESLHLKGTRQMEIMDVPGKIRMHKWGKSSLLSNNLKFYLGE